MSSPARRKLTTLDKLKVLARDGRCEICGEKLGRIEEIEFDHRIPLALGGEDSLENLRAVHADCHAVKTFGTKATTRGSDINEIARAKRLSRKQDEFRRRLLAKGEPEALQAETLRPKGRKFPPGRKFPKRKKEDRP